MKKTEFYNRMKKIIQDSYGEYNKIKAEYDYIEAEKASGKFDNAYINDTLRPKQYELQRKMRGLQDAAKADISKLMNEAEKSLRDLDALKPEELTDDIRLLNSGIKLNKYDLQAILERNRDNRTMTQLTIRFAKDHQIEGFEHTWYKNTDDEVRSYKSMAGVGDIMIKWYDNPQGFESMFNKCMGEGSELYNFCHSGE